MKIRNFKEIAILLCIISALAIVLAGKEGWGWFLFIALLLS